MSKSLDRDLLPSEFGLRITNLVRDVAEKAWVDAQANVAVEAGRDQVQPMRGSILYVDMAFGMMERSGVYLVDCKIAHVEGSGHIRIVGPFEFMSGTTALFVCVSSNGRHTRIGAQESGPPMN